MELSCVGEAALSRCKQPIPKTRVIRAAAAVVCMAGARALRQVGSNVETRKDSERASSATERDCSICQAYRAARRMGDRAEISVAFWDEVDRNVVSTHCRDYLTAVAKAHNAQQHAMNGNIRTAVVLVCLALAFSADKAQQRRFSGVRKVDMRTAVPSQHSSLRALELP